MKKKAQEGQIIKKYLTASVGLLLFSVLRFIKPAIVNNNHVLKVCFFISFGFVCLLTLMIASARFFYDDKFAGIVYEIGDYLSFFVIICCLFQSIMVFGFFSCDVEGSSMEQALQNGDKLIARSSRKVKKGNIIIFEHESNLYVKRVIAEEGDYLEDYLNINEIKNTEGLDDNYRVKQGYTFVLGDNRKNSRDSRAFGAIENEKIVGIVKLRRKSFLNWEPVT